MFEKHRSRIRLKLNFMDVIIIHEVEFKADATAVILRDPTFFGTVPPNKNVQTTRRKSSPFFVLCLRCSYRKV